MSLTILIQCTTTYSMDVLFYPWCFALIQCSFIISAGQYEFDYRDKGRTLHLQDTVCLYCSSCSVVTAGETSKPNKFKISDNLKSLRDHQNPNLTSFAHNKDQPDKTISNLGIHYSNQLVFCYCAQQESDECMWSTKVKFILDTT